MSAVGPLLAVAIVSDAISPRSLSPSEDSEDWLVEDIEMDIAIGERKNICQIETHKSLEQKKEKPAQWNQDILF